MNKKTENKKEEEDSFISLENQMIRGAMHTHTNLSNYSARINEIEAFTYGIADALVESGLLSTKAIYKVVENLKTKMAEKQEQLHPDIQVRLDREGAKEYVAVNCAERMPICKAVCCSLRFALSKEEIEAGHVRWDLGHPYFIRHEGGCCTHKDKKTGACGVYDNRPRVCSEYSCATDDRIWKDFEKMELNLDYIREHFSNPDFEEISEK